MGLREELGHKIEEMLNKIVDEQLSVEKLAPMLDSLLKGQLESLKHKIKADVIDLIDGVDDVK